MKTIIRLCYENGLSLQDAVRTYIKNLPKTKETGTYKGN